MKPRNEDVFTPRYIRRLCTLTLFLMLVLAAAWFATSGLRAETTDDWPAKPQRVMDMAHVLSPDAVTRIDAKIAALEHRTTAQMVVVTIPRLPADAPTLADLQYPLFHRYPIGTADANNGLFLVFDMGAHEDRAMVGSGLDAAITGVDASDTLQRVARPLLRRGDVDGAIEVSVDAFAAKIPVADSTGDATVASASANTDKGGSAWAWLLVPGTIIAGWLGFCASRRRRHDDTARRRDEDDRQWAEQDRRWDAMRQLSSNDLVRQSQQRTRPRNDPPFVPMRPMRPPPPAPVRTARRDDDSRPSRSNDDSFGSALAGGIVGAAIGSVFGGGSSPSASSDYGSSSSDSGSSGGGDFSSGGGDSAGGGGGGDW